MPEQYSTTYSGEDASALEQFLELSRIISSLSVFSLSYLTVITTTHTANRENVVLVDDDTAGAGVTVSLLPAADVRGRIHIIKKLGTTGSVTIDADGAELIDGATTKVLSAQYASVQIISDGSVWHIIG